MGDLEARREARRRKILENSESRLKKITSLDSPAVSSEKIDKGFVSLEEQTTEGVHLRPISVRSSSNNEDTRPQVTFRQPSLLDERRQTKYSTQSDSSRVDTIFMNPIADENESVSEFEFESFVTQKRYLTFINLRLWFLMLVALTVRCLLYVRKHNAYPLKLTNIDGLHLNKIFVPFLAYESIEYIVYRPPVQTNSMMFSLLVMSNLQTNHVRILLSVLEIVFKIMTDLMIYFFTFVVSDQLIVTMMEKR